MQRFTEYMGWPATPQRGHGEPDGYFPALPMTAYNAVTPVETEASRRLRRRAAEPARRQAAGTGACGPRPAPRRSRRRCGPRWPATARRDMILATRFGFHGKKGLAGAVTGCETDRDRDPRVRFISFPMAECADVSHARPAVRSRRRTARNWTPCCTSSAGGSASLITEPYLGGGGSYHPPKAYLQLLQAFCREHDIVFILDEVQANFGRTGDLFAYRDLRPRAGHRRARQGAGQRRAGGGGGRAGPTCSPASTTAKAPTPGAPTRSAAPPCWPRSTSSPPATCSAPCRRSSAIIEEGLVRLKELPFVANVRGEKGGMVWGVEMRDHAGRTAAEWANAAGAGLLPRRRRATASTCSGPLAKKVVRIAPPLVITEAEAREAMALMHRLLQPFAAEPAGKRVALCLRT